MATPPSVVVYKDAYALGSSATRVLGSITVATGDVVAVVGETENWSGVFVSSLAKSAGTATIGTVTKQREAGSASHCGNGLFTFTVTAGGTLTLTATFSTTPTNTSSTFWTYVATGSGGIGNTALTTSASSTITASLTTSANSYVIAHAADWAATGGATTTLTPGGGVLDAHETDGVVDQSTAGGHFSSRGGHWADSGAPATTSYGVTVPTSATGYDLVVCELLGSAGGPDTEWAARQWKTQRTRRPPYVPPYGRRQRVSLNVAPSAALPTYTRVHSPVWSNSNTSGAALAVTVAPTNIGDIMIAGVFNQGGTSVASLSGGGCTTWQRIGSPWTDPEATPTVQEFWYGIVTSTGSSSLSVTWNAAVGAHFNEITVQDFHCSVSGTWTVEGLANQSNGTSSNTVTYPAVVPSHAPEIYVGYASTPSAIAASSPLPAGAVVGLTSGNDCFIYHTSYSSGTVQNTVTISNTPSWGIGIGIYMDTGGAPTPVALADAAAATDAVSLKMDALQDNFPGSSVDATKWTSFNTATVASNTLTLTDTASSTLYSGINSVGRYDLTGSYLLAHCTNGGLQATSTQAMIQCVLDANNSLGLIINNGNLIAQTAIAGSYVQRASIAWSGATMSWLRIRESGGTIFWDYSADGITWNNLTSLAAPFAVTALQANVQEGAYNPTDPQATSTWQSVNLAPAAITLADAAAAVEQQASPAAVPLAEVAAGADVVAVPAETIGLAEVAGAAEQLAVSATVPVADAAAGGESVSLNATVPLAEVGSAAETVALAATVPLAERAAGVEALTYLVGVSTPDVAGSSEALAATATVPLSEAAAGVESATVSASLAVTDAAAAADQISVSAAAPLTDAGCGAEAPATTATVPLADVAGAFEVNPIGISQAEMAGAAEAISVTQVVPITLAEQAGGTEARQLNSNTAFAGGSTANWVAFQGAITGSTSPPAGCPEPSAVQYTNNGVSPGALEGNAGANRWAARPSTSYTVSTWVYSSVASVTIGFDWLDQANTFLSATTQTFSVTPNTWTLLVATVTSHASAVRGYARVGSNTLSAVVWATDVLAFGPDTLSISATVPVADTAGGQEQLTVTAAASVADAAGAVEQATASAVVPVADAGAGAEAQLIGLLPADAAAAAEALSVSATVPAADAAGAADTVSVGQGSQVTLADAAGALEASSAAVASPVTEAAGAADALTAAAALVFGDQAGAADAIAVVAGANPQLPDAGAAVESSSVSAGVSTADTAGSVESAAATATVPLPERAAGVEAANVSAILGLPEAGSAADGLAVAQAAQPVLADAGGGTEALSASAAVPCPDSAAASESLVVTQARFLADTAAAAEGLIYVIPPTGPQPVWEAGPAEPRWQAVATGPAWQVATTRARWEAVATPPRWDVSAAPARWRVLMAVFEPVASVSVENVNATWTSDLGGTEVDPTTGPMPVKFSFPASSGDELNPAQPSSWYTGTWLIPAAGRYKGFIAQVIIGPTAQGGLVQLTRGGKYDVWSEVDTGTETVRKFVGVLPVY